MACNHMECFPKEDERYLPNLLNSWQTCLFCKAWLWRGGRWSCEGCGGIAHTECVPVEIRIKAVREKEARGYPLQRAVVLKWNKPENLSNVINAGPEIEECTQHLPNSATQDSIPFQYPSGNRMQKAGPPADVSAGLIKWLLHDFVGGEKLFKNISWSITDIRTLTAIHHRRYLRRLVNRPRVQENQFFNNVQVAFRYAAAVYGNGKLSGTVFGGVQLNASDYMSAVIDRLDWGKQKCGKILQWSWLPKPGEDLYEPGYFLGVDLQRKTGILSVRGTIYTTDLQIDVTGANRLFLDGYGHTGIIESSLKLFSLVEHTVSDLFLSPTSMYYGWPLILSGHSLGAGVISCLILLFKHNGYLDKGLKLTGYAFGVPSCLSKNLANEISPYLISIVHGKDFCPRTSIQTLHDLDSEMRYPPGLWGHAHIPASVAAALITVFSSMLGEEDHVVSCGEEESEVDTGKVYPPGTQYLIHTVTSDSQEQAMLPTLHPHPRGSHVLFEISPQTLSGLLLSLSMVTVHPWKAYLGVINSLKI